MTAGFVRDCEVGGRFGERAPAEEETGTGAGENEDPWEEESKE